jgi:hypothetical protein
MRRGRGSVPLVVEEEKRGDGASMHAIRSWAVPGPLIRSCPVLRDAWPTACARRPGADQHPRLSTLLLWERAPEAEAFPEAIVRCGDTS